MKIKKYYVRSNGALPDPVLKLVAQMDGMPVTDDRFYILDEEIKFLVVDCGIGHGNTTKSEKTGWIYSKENGGNLWNVNFDVK